MSGKEFDRLKSNNADMKKIVSISRNYFPYVLVTFMMQAFLFRSRQCVEDFEPLPKYARNNDS